MKLKIQEVYMIKKNASDKYVLTAEDAELLARFYMQSTP